MQLTYAIRYVADMERAVAFYRDSLGLPLSFQSPFWREFATGETKLALHPTSERNPAGSVQLGFGTEDLAGLYDAREANGLAFTLPPTPQHEAPIGRFLDCEGVECSIGKAR